jgi:Ca-activated chloride channel family protein
MGHVAMRRNLGRLTQHPSVLIGLGVVLGLAIATMLMGWKGLWATPDQRGAWLLRHDRYDQAADRFQDPVWRGVALMKAGRFKEAAESFADIDTAEAAYDRGNALVMLGQYPEAVAQYDRALSLRPAWPDAVANRALAQLRAERFAHLQGEQADQVSKVTDETYRRDRLRRQQDEPSAPAVSAMSDQAIRALWLRRVQTRPADFLRARFAYQAQHHSADRNP